MYSMSGQNIALRYNDTCVYGRMLMCIIIFNIQEGNNKIL